VASGPAGWASVDGSGPLGEDTLVLTILILILHIIVSVALIFLILMHSGKGGGLSDMFGGAVGQAASGSTVVEKNLDRITVTVAIIFGFTSIALSLRLH